MVPEAENKDKNFVHRIYDRHYVRGGEKMKAVLDHWDDESWFEPKRKEGELAFWPSLSVEELLGVISVEEAKKRGFAIEGETSKIEDKKEEPKAKSTIQYSKESFDEK